MKAFIVEWYASGYCGSFRYSVIARTLNEAKEVWEKFILQNEKLLYSWKKAERGVKNHYGGFIRWEEIGETNKEYGCYELEFDRWNTGSDHLMD